MTAFVCGFQVRQIEMQVERGGFEFDVTEHELDVADVATVRQQAGGKGMPEGMATARPAGIGKLDEIMDVRSQS